MLFTPIEIIKALETLEETKVSDGGEAALSDVTFDGKIFVTSVNSGTVLPETAEEGEVFFLIKG